MATWHQERAMRRDPSIGFDLWVPHDTGWKVVDDKPGQSAGCIILPDKESAERYVANAGGVIIAPKKA